MRLPIFLLLVSMPVSAQLHEPISIPNQFSDGTVASSAAVNANFSEVAEHVAYLESFLFAYPEGSASNGFGSGSCGTVCTNLAVGDGLQSLQSNGANGTGSGNTAFGVTTLFDLTTGTDNTAAGISALRHLTGGSNNSAFGAGAMSWATSGHANTVIGYNALGSCQGQCGGLQISRELGDWNTVVGAYATLRQETNDYYDGSLSSRNTVIGAYASSNGAYNISIGAGDVNTGASSDGVANISIGGYAAGTENTVIGAGAMTLCEACGFVGSVALGRDSWILGNDEVQIGGYSVTDVYLGLRDDGRLAANQQIVDDLIPEGDTVADTNLFLRGKVTSGAVTYPNTHGSNGQVLGTNGSGELVWLSSGQIVASYTQELKEQVVSLQEQLQSQQEELLAIVQSQQEQIAQLQRMVEHQFALN
ncbi:MAG: hypothetical protein L7S70_11060 [Pseudomonadales bacterium]|nr:hypothetical protein [Pseudomonadales bacterium]